VNPQVAELSQQLAAARECSAAWESTAAAAKEARANLELTWRADVSYLTEQHAAEMAQLNKNTQVRGS
jgi:hypothetical protein